MEMICLCVVCGWRFVAGCRRLVADAAGAASLYILWSNIYKSAPHLFQGMSGRCYAQISTGACWGPHARMRARAGAVSSVFFVRRPGETAGAGLCAGRAPW